VKYIFINFIFSSINEIFYLNNENFTNMDCVMLFVGYGRICCI
jgi:hypothetical protein